MPTYTDSRNATSNQPNQFPYNLIDIFDPVMGPNNQVTVFFDDEADPHFANPYSMEIADAIYWIGYSEGHELTGYDISNICDHIYSYVSMAQGEL